MPSSWSLFVAPSFSSLWAAPQKAPARMRGPKAPQLYHLVHQRGHETRSSCVQHFQENNSRNESRGVHRSSRYYPGRECVHNTQKSYNLGESCGIHPLRFNPEESDRRGPYDYVPFSAGSRNCIGQNFAMNEMKVVIGTLVNCFILEVDESYPVEIVPWVVLRMKNDIKLYVKSCESIFIVFNSSLIILLDV